MLTTSLTNLSTDPEWIQTWSVKQGRVDLYRRKNSFEAILSKQKKTTKIAQNWISGLPESSLIESQDLLKNYFSETYVSLRQLKHAGYKLYINPRLIGGMLPRKDLSKMIVQSKSTLNNNNHQPTIKSFQKISFISQELTKRMEDRGDNKFKILSIDGGGTRGIIPLKIAKALECLIGPLHQTFDLIGGTSTGGVISLGLTTPYANYSVDDILKIYQARSSEIFIHNPQRRMHNLIASLAGFSSSTRDKTIGFLKDNPIYTDKGLNQVAKELLGESLMKDAKTNILIPAVDITEGTPNLHWFTNIDENDSLLAMRDVACATSAAPTYFPHKWVNYRRYIDGGLGCNNPALQCHLHAERNHVNPAYEYILSLGTGFADVEGISTREDKHNLLYWAKSIFSVVGSVQSSQVDINLKHIVKDRYWRINPCLDEEIPLDSFKDDVIKYLSDIGDQLVEDSQDRIREIAKELRPDEMNA